MDELKLIFASNLIKLRTEAGMTQAELGEQLNYSDKTISKWERGESIPDAYVLTRISALFHISLDDLLTSHDQWQQPDPDPQPKLLLSFRTLVALCVCAIWTLVLFLFIVFWILGSVHWLILLAAIPVSLITVLVLNCIWGRTRYNAWVVGALILSLLVLVYFLLRQYHPWQLFLLAVPAELVVWLSFRITHRR